MAVLLIVDALGFLGRPAEVEFVFLGFGFLAGAVLLFFHLSETVDVSQNGLVWRQLFRSRRELAWSEIDAACDRETAILFRCSWKGTTIRISRWLPGFDDALSAAQKFIAVDALLTPQWKIPLPAKFRVGWNNLAGSIVIGVLGAGMGAIAALAQDSFVALFAVSLAAFAAWILPYLKLEIHEDRFELVKPWRRRIVEMAQVESVAFDTTEFHGHHGIKAGQLTSNLVVVKTADGTTLEFAPRTGALATWLCASAAVEASRASRGQ